MSLKKVKKYFIAHIVARVVYLFAATIISLGMIMLIILSINILLPYMWVINYQNATCVVNNTVLANVDGCVECPRANTTRQPCIQITVRYNSTDNGPQTALLHLNEYNVLSDDVCSFATCAAFYWQNAKDVDDFGRQYGRPGQSYSCLYDPYMYSRVIVRREHDGTVILHSLLWPSLSIVLGLLLIIIFYLWVGCDIWGSRIATVMWEKSLKRLEMEQEIRRRTNNNFHRKSLNS